MRRFNPEKELKKIENGNRNKILYGIIALLLIVAVGSTYALYQVRHTKSLVYTTVSDFKKRDIYLSVLVDGKTQGDFPKNNEGKIYTGIECDKPYSEAYFDNTEWKLHFTSDGPNKCTVKFETGNLPNAPELFQGMIPIVYGDNGLMYVADTSKDWYNYQDHRWANAVLVDASQANIKSKYFDENNQLRTDIAGIQVPMEEILQMYVWIPRYKYQLWNVNNEGKPKQLINIKFEKNMENTGDITCTYTNNDDGTITEDCKNKNTNEKANNGEWYTHPAFKFGNTELSGIWIGKFEPSDPNDPTGRTTDVLNEITILPNKTSVVNKSLISMFNAVRHIETNSKYNLNSNLIDTHIMKNIEWGVVAYLTQSVYGIYKDEKTCNIQNMEFNECKIWKNNISAGDNVTYTDGGTATGCVGNSVDAGVEWNSKSNAIANCPEGRKWDESGVKASTTGNMYGIYDLYGGVLEVVMSFTADKNGIFFGNSGFQTDTLPNIKYYDEYSTGIDTDHVLHSRGHLGDAIRETLKVYGSSNGSWDNGLSHFSTSKWPFLNRGGNYNESEQTSIFSFARTVGGKTYITNHRIALTAQDGKE